MSKILCNLYLALAVGLNLACFAVSPAIGQYSGPLSGYFPADDYYIIGDIWIDMGEVLEIAAPSIFFFTGPYSFSIYGQLIANGSMNDSILFIPDLGVDSWKGLKIEAPESNPTQLFYCRISDSDSSGIDCQNSSIILENCTVSGNTSPGNGGGINLSDADAELRACVVQDNFSGMYGGGISCWDNTNVILEECLIDSNDALNADGMGLYARNCDPVVRSCTFSNQYRGGARIDSSAAQFEECLFVGNASEGMVVENSTPTFTHCTFLDNLIGLQIFWSEATVTECTFSGNELAGINVQNCTPGISNCLIHDNLGDGVQSFNNGFPDLESCTITGNGGSGIYCYTGGCNLINSVVTDNDEYGFAFDLVGQVTYTDFWNNGQGLYSGTPPPGFGELLMTNVNGDSCDGYFNLFIDPEFIDTFHGDYRLQWGSPCIDAGDPAPQYNDPDGTVGDLGVFYYDQSVSIRILLTPYGVPIEIPVTGGAFDFAIHVTNIALSALNIDVWCDLTLPNGTAYGPVLGPVNLHIGSELTISRERTQTVPGNAPAGTYTYNVYATTDSDTSMDSFTFVKLGGDEIRGITGWLNGEEQLDNPDNKNPVPDPAEGYSLIRNHPNPFNTETLITFELPNYSKVNLSVYDALGRKLADLMDAWKKAGIYEVGFGRGDLSSGIYFYRFEAGDYIATGKMVFIK